MLLRAELARDAGGAVSKWYGTATDIHDARRSAEIHNGVLTLLQEIAASTSAADDVLELAAKRLMTL